MSSHRNLRDHAGIRSYFRGHQDGTNLSATIYGQVAGVRTKDPTARVLDKIAQETDAALVGLVVVAKREVWRVKVTVIDRSSRLKKEVFAPGYDPDVRWRTQRGDLPIAFLPGPGSGSSG